MTPLQAIKTGFRKSFDFKGRTTRSEFWWFATMLAFPFAFCLIYLLFGYSIFGDAFYKNDLLDQIRGAMEKLLPITPLFLVPGISCGIRRNQDAQHTTSMTIATSVVFFGGYALIVLFAFYEYLSDVRGSITWLFALLWLLVSVALAIPTIILWLRPSHNASDPTGPNPSEVIQ